MSRSHQYKKSARSIVWKALGLVIVSSALLAGTFGISTIREYVSRASSEPANIVVDTSVVIGPLPRPWQYLAQGGEEAAWRIQPINAQVKALNPQYIRIDHIYDFYDIVKGTPGNLSFDFSKFDVILNDITATGAKPYISLSYMPPAIAAGDIISEPQRYEDWQLTVQKTIEHVSGTRGISDVYYEVWNEPDLFGGWKMYGSKNYLDLYGAAARGAQNARVSQSFKIGGPAITALYKNWFDGLLKYASDNNLRLDFFSWHRYATDLTQFSKDMYEVRTWIQKYPQYEPTLEFHITEWGHDSKNHAGYDSSFSAAHTVAGAIEMVGVIDKAFVFEIQDGKDPEGKAQWGRWGMLTHRDFGSLPKPRYRGLLMLEKLGYERLELLGKGSYVKAVAARKNETTYQVMLSNFDPFAKNVETVPITFTNVTPGRYRVSKTYLNKQPEIMEVTSEGTNLMIFVPMGISEVALVEITQY
jgi:beta-xylosidase